MSIFCYVNITASKVNKMGRNQFLGNPEQTLPWGWFTFYSKSKILHLV